MLVQSAEPLGAMDGRSANSNADSVRCEEKPASFATDFIGNYPAARASPRGIPSAEGVAAPTPAAPLPANKPTGPESGAVPSFKNLGEASEYMAKLPEDQRGEFYRTHIRNSNLKTVKIN